MESYAAKPLRVLITTGLFPPEIGGPATYSKLMAEALPAYGFVVKVLPFSKVRTWPKGIRHFLFFWHTCRLALGSDIIFAQDTISVGWPSLFAAKLLHKKFIIRVPGDHAWEQAVQSYGVTDSIDDFQTKHYGRNVERLRAAQSFVVSHADWLIVPSHYFQAIVSGWLKRLVPVTVIYNGIEINFAKKYPPRYLNRDKMLVSAGRLVPWKGFAGLIQLVSLVPGWKLTIVGDGPQKDELINLAKKLEVADRIIFAGVLPRTDLRKLMNKSRIFILNTSFESFSFQTVEAMVAGIPVVATNIGSIPELITNNQEGLLVDPDNIKQMIEAISRIDNYEQVRTDFVQRAKDKVQQFSIDKTVVALADLLHQL